jgi:hypothetical protein
MSGHGQVGDDIAVYVLLPVNDSEIASVERILTAGVQHLMNLGHEQELRWILTGYSIRSKWKVRTLHHQKRQDQLSTQNNNRVPFEA